MKNSEILPRFQAVLAARQERHNARVSKMNELLELYQQANVSNEVQKIQLVRKDQDIPQTELESSVRIDINQTPSVVTQVSSANLPISQDHLIIDVAPEEQEMLEKVELNSATQEQKEVKTPPANISPSNTQESRTDVEANSLQRQYSVSPRSINFKERELGRGPNECKRPSVQALTKRNFVEGQILFR